MKNTKQKLLILDIINNNRCHNTAEDVYKKARQTISNISLGTVYRNLNSLVEEKKIRRINMDDGIERFDHTLNNHNHFICENCNDLIDIEDNSYKLKDINGNKVMSYEIFYKGICKKCLEKEN